MTNPFALVCWEAQFGDFNNTAQVYKSVYTAYRVFMVLESAESINKYPKNNFLIMPLFLHEIELQKSS